MKKNSLFVLLSAVILVCGAACSKQSAESLLKKASEQAVAGQWENAEKNSGAAVSAEPSNGNALLLHGLALKQCGKSEEAYAEFRKAAEVMPQSFHAQYHLGQALCAKQRYDSAIAPLKRALALRNRDANTLILLSDACFRQKNYTESARYCSMLVRMPAFQKNAAVWSTIGFIYIANGNHKEAGKCFYYAHTLDRKNPVMTLNYAVCLDRYQRQRKSAAEYYRLYLAQTARDTSQAKTAAAVRSRLAVLR